jgi:hypothetical protein
MVSAAKIFHHHYLLITRPLIIWMVALSIVMTITLPAMA